MVNFVLIDGAWVNLDHVVRIEFEPATDEPKTRVFISCSDGVAIDVRDDSAPELYTYLASVLKPKQVGVTTAVKKASKKKPAARDASKDEETPK